MAIRDLGLQPSSAVDSVGQIIALAIAGATAMRAPWLFGNLFVHQIKDTGRLGFQWLFQLQLLSKYKSYAAWFRFPDFTTSPDWLKPGAFIRDPMDVRSTVQINGDFIAPSPERPVVRTGYATVNTESLRGYSHVGEHIVIDNIKIFILDLRQTYRYIYKIMDEGGFAEHLGSRSTGLRRVRLYMVSGVMIAKGVHVSTRYPRAEAGVALDVVLSVGGLRIGGGMSRTAEREESFESGSEFLFAYMLVEITFNRKKDRILRIMLYIKGADIV